MLIGVIMADKFPGAAADLQAGVHSLPPLFTEETPGSQRNSFIKTILKQTSDFAFFAPLR
jgi:hypothetical protein